MKKRGKKIILIGTVVIVAFIVLGFALNRVPAITYQPQDTDTEAQWGTITGSLGYPSEGIPPMGVCAETVDQKELYCTYSLLSGSEYTYGQGYALQVPPGTYRVFAHLVTDTNAKIGYTNEARAYYSHYVLCGMSIGCADHQPVAVAVKASEQVKKIDPIDWINQ